MVEGIGYCCRRIATTAVDQVRQLLRHVERALGRPVELERVAGSRKVDSQKAL
jgi:hypothetical protein